MSFVVIPSDIFSQRSAEPSYLRCGPSFAPVRQRPARTAIPSGLLGALFDDDDDDVVFTDAPSLAPWQEFHLEQLRRQEYLEAERRRRNLVARQQQAELERQVVRARLEKAARVAWHQEQQRKAALALEYQRRLEAHKRRQQEQEEYAHRVRLAQQAKAAQLQQAKAAQQAKQAQQAQQAQQKEIDWEQVAAQSIFGVMDLVQHLFGGEEQDKSTSKVDGKKPEKTTEQVNAEQAKQAEVEKPKEKEVDTMQVDQQETATEQAKEVEQAVVANKEEVVPEQAVQASTEKVETQSEQLAAQAPQVDAHEEQAQSQEEAKKGRLVFTYPLPQDEAARSNLKAEDIGVSYDEASHTIQLTGLWANDDASASSSSSQEESRGRTRSRSPKRPRVSDVDEQTGEEIVKNDDTEDGFVQVSKVQAPTNNTTTKSIRLPQDATVDHLLAELTDEGFKVYV